MAEIIVLAIVYTPVEQNTLYTPCIDKYKKQTKATNSMSKCLPMDVDN
jgi:hypothetical protein